MSAQYVSSTLIRNLMAKNGKPVAVEFVDRTTAWVRPAGYPSNSVKEDFAQVASENISAFKVGTATIAMKESQHQSDKDKRIHYTAYGLDDNKKVIDIQYLTKEKK